MKMTKTAHIPRRKLLNKKAKVVEFDDIYYGLMKIDDKIFKIPIDDAHEDIEERLDNNKTTVRDVWDSLYMLNIIPEITQEEFDKCDITNILLR